MSSGPSDYRRRSRSPVVPVGDIARLLNEQSERLSEHLRRKRRGKQHKRTSKSLLLTLLEYYLYIIQFAGDASGHAASYVRRQTQISNTWTAVKYNRWFPRQGDPLLLRADGISRRKKRKRNLSGDHRSRITHRQGDLVSWIIHCQSCLHLREWCQELLVW